MGSLLYHLRGRCQIFFSFDSLASFLYFPYLFYKVPLIYFSGPYSLSYGLSIFREEKRGGKDTLELETNSESSEESGGKDTLELETNTESSEVCLVLFVFVS